MTKFSEYDQPAGRDASDKSSDDAIIAAAKRRFRIASEATTRLREDALDDIRFFAGEQWPDSIKAQRAQGDRPCLTINKLPTFVKQITNEQRQNRLGIQVNPAGDEADPETAEKIQGMIRHIEVQSGSDMAVDTAFEHAVIHGFGYIRVLTDYIDPMSFDQEISIGLVRNPFAVYFDPASEQPDYSDAGYAFLVRRYSRDAFEAEFPGSSMASMSDFQSIGDQEPDWVGADGALVAEHWWKEHTRETIAQCADGQVRFLRDVPRGIPVLKKRDTMIPVIRYIKMSACEILERETLQGKWIPLVPVLGNDLDVNGIRQLSGIIRHAKDPQRMYNYWATAETETIALAPKAPIVGAAGQFEGFENEWAAANSDNLPFLQYNPLAIGDHLAPAPQRQVFEPPIQAISHARLQSADDLKSVTGIYDASLGAQGNETSGRAILARRNQGATANLHLSDNLKRALRHLGRIILDLIPYIYDTPRIQRIIGLEDEQTQVPINQAYIENGEQKLIDVTTGRYDVTITAGPSYATKRQEAVESMIDLTKAFPGLVPVIGDIMVKNMDWPGAEKCAERMKKMLPPNLADDDNQQKQAIPPQVQQYMDALGQQHDQLVALLHQSQDALEREEYKYASQERIKLMEIQADLVKTEAQLNAKDGIERLKLEISQIQNAIGSVNSQMESDAQRRHASEEAANARAADQAAQQMPEAA